jgi:hypothetical protein
MLAGHKEFSEPGRKIDPRYDMDDMRAQVEAHTRSEPPTPIPPEDDMPLTQADADLVARTLLNAKIGSKGIVGWTVAHCVDGTTRTVMEARDLAKALPTADAIADAVIAKLQEGSPDLTAIKQAVKDALRELVGPQP